MKKQNICKFITTRDLGQLRVDQFFFESIVPHSGKERTLNVHCMYLVNSGMGRYCCAGEYHTLTPGCLFFSFADIPGVIENTGELQYYCIGFSGGRAEELFQRFGVTPKHCLFSGCEGLLPLWQESLARASDDTLDLLSESLLLYSFSRLKKAEHSGSDAVAFVLNYLENHFTRRTLSLGEVAAAAGYHEKYLSHLFKKQFGMGFSEYLRLLRIKHAVTLMENGVTSVKNVALLSGFSDPLYFSRVFTEAVGVSPKNYLQKNKE